MYIDFLQRRTAVAVSRWRHRVGSAAEVPSDVNVLLVTVSHELSRTQIYPFYFYQRTLQKKYGVKFAELPLEALMPKIASGAAIGARCLQIKRIFFQPFLYMTDDDQVKALQYLSETFPNARIALMDWFAPLHIRPSVSANPYIDIYIKKQVYKEFSNFAKPTVGDTNLNDYYARRHQLADAPMEFSPPPGIEGKLRLGSNFGFSPQMVDLFLGAPPQAEGRDIDLHARIAINGAPWYRVMRQESKDAVDRLRGLKIVSEGRVRRPKFFQEMRRSKICFSPFGYGEVCWRDYEAFATGALLLKPDMSHLTVQPEVFVPNETYISIRWDLADFEEKIRETMANFDRAGAMRQEVFSIMQRWILSEDAAAQIGALC